MILQDGFGGSGARVSLAVLNPAQKQMSIVQEQYAKTGILLARSFDLPKGESTWLSPVPISRESTSRSGMSRTQTEKRNAELSETTASGGWFTSRALQSQIIHSTRMNRGGIEVTMGDAPTAINSLPSPLRYLFIQDDQKRLWTAENVSVGQKATLILCNRDSFTEWLKKNARSHMGMLMRDRIDHMTPDKGEWFFAEMMEPTKIAVPTLATIQWTHDRAFVAGKIESK